jgi:hypothetical protein
MKTFACFLLGVTCLYGCSSDAESANAPPVIDAVDGPTETTAEGANQTATFTIRWHDDDKDAVTTVRYRIDALGIDQTNGQPGANPNVIGAQLKLIFPGTIPKSSYDIAFTAIDARGAESAVVTKSVTVK